MDSESSNPFYDSGDRKYRRGSNHRSFFDDGPEPEPSPNNPFYESSNHPSVYKRGGYKPQNGASSHRQELFGSAGTESRYNSKSLFDEEEDDFDVDAPFDAEAYRQKLLLKKMKESANRQMDSQHRSLAVIEDSEQMGVSTAEELLRQREQLDNVERKTADINKTMDVSEKHVNKISSIFGGLKGWFRKKEEPIEPSVPQRDTKLQDTVDAYRSNSLDKNQHPAVRMRDADRAQQSSTNAPGSEKLTSRQIFEEYDHNFHRNLDVMSDGISRLKGLGLVLQTEIETQTEQIDRINSQVTKADDKVVTQTKRINNMLKK